MHGFKSFASRTEILLGDRFNCILGPNGSGKSNVLDALCFVLGKSSVKGLRAEKSANLIYNGGKTKKPAKQAEVSIYFDNTKKIFPTDSDEVKVTRLVKKNGQGVYKINDQTRTRTQILELLSLAKIDPDGYNIVLQGDINKIIDMTPTERRTIIEEISGISIYEDKKQKAIRELDKVEGRLNEAAIILSEREVYLQELKKERDQARKFKNLQDKINSNKATFFHRQIQTKSAEREELDERVKKHNEKIILTNEDITKIKKEIAELKQEIDNINKEIEHKGEKEQLELHREIEKTKIEVATAKNRIESCKDEISKIDSRKENLGVNLNELEEKIKITKQRKEEIAKDIDFKRKQGTEINIKIDQFKKKHKLNEISTFEKDIDEFDKKAEDLQLEIQSLRQKQQEFLREKDKLEFQIESADEKINKVLELEKENKEQVQQLKQKKIEFKNSTLELNKILDLNTRLSAEGQQARTQMLSTQEELSRLRAKNMQIQEKLGGNIAIKKILENKKKFPGVYGTVSELGEVNSKYSLALEVAAGNKTKSIVVENDKVAAECITYLKSNKLGIATFLPINKIRSRSENPAIRNIATKPGVQGKAVELISFDPKFKNIFSYIFDNTLVVDNIQTARNLGIGIAKMVTLDGDIAEVSGAMQGGFRRRKEGVGFGEKEVSSKIADLEKRSADLGMRLSKIEKDKNQSEEEITKLRQFKAHLEGDIIKLEKALHLDSDDLDINKKIKKEFKEKVIIVDKELQLVVGKLSMHNREIADYKIKKQTLRTKVNELRSPTLIAELNAFEEKKVELKESIIKQDSEHNSVKTQLETMLLPEKENIQKVLKQHDKEIDAFDKEVKTLSDNIQLQERDLKGKEEKQKKFYAQYKDLFNKRTKFSDTVSKKENRLFNLNDDLRKSEHKINTINIELARINAELSAINHQFEEYKEYPIDQEKSDSQIQREITQFENIVSDLGAVNLKALEIYDNVEREYNDLLDKKSRLAVEKEDVLKLMEEIEGKKKILFLKTFDAIQEHFQELFRTLTTKGEASLVLEAPEDPFAGGLHIKVKIAGTKFLDIRSLSGGEKTMTALAFIFSVQEYDPASFYVLDEVDAALDKKNSEKLSSLIQKYGERAQYVLISHNDGVISNADCLFGVSMNTDGKSKVLSLKI